MSGTRALALITMATLMVASCGIEDAVDHTLPLADPPPGLARPGSSTTTTAEATTSTTTRPVEAGAIVTPTGVVVAVLDQGIWGYRVLTPCGGEAVVSAGTPVGPVQVVVDPGHGGEVDTGAVGPNGMREADLNLALSRALGERLNGAGVRTILTRSSDHATDLEVRGRLADHLGADLLVSVHHNSPTPNPAPTPGTEVYVQSRSAESRRLGGLIWEEVVEALADFDVMWAAAPDAGVLVVLNSRGNDAYGMVRGPETVAALVEMGYLSNPSEASLFATDEYLAAASQALADAVIRHLHTEDTGSGHVPTPRTFNPQPGISRSVCEDPVLE